MQQKEQVKAKIKEIDKKYGIDAAEMLKQSMRDAGFKTFVDTDGVEKPL